MAYNLRPRKPPRTDPLLTACTDNLPQDVLEYIYALRVAMPPRYPLRSRLSDPPVDLKLHWLKQQCYSIDSNNQQPESR